MDTRKTVVTRICPACNQKIRNLNPHKMDSQKLQLLEMLNAARGEWVYVNQGSHVQLEGRLYTAPYRAGAHAARLDWFGLADRGSRRSGLYRINAKGRAFLKGKITVPATIYCKEGKVVEVSDDVISVHEARITILDKNYWNNYRGKAQYLFIYDAPSGLLEAVAKLRKHIGSA